MKPSMRWLLLLPALCIATHQVWAEPDSEAPSSGHETAVVPSTGNAPSALETYRLDLVVPELPAMVAIGSSSDNITNPQSWRALAAALANGLAPDGSLQTGIGVEAAPFAYGNVQLDRKQVGSGYAPTLRSLRLSISTLTKSLGGTQRTFASAGGRWTWAYDPVEDEALRRCLVDALTPVGDESPGKPGAGAEIKNVGLERCREIYRRYHVVSNGIEIASAVFGATDEGNKVADLAKPSLSSWISGQVVPMRLPGSPVDESDSHSDSTLVLRAGLRYDQALSSVIATDVSGTAKSALAIDLRAGMAGPSGDIYVEYSYQKAVSVSDGASKPSEHRAIIGGDIKIGDNLWMTGGVGASDPSWVGAWKALAMADLKWGLGNSPAYR